MDNTKLQIAESIKEHSNILVTVSADPSVDELSAALGLTIVLDNLDKRATAVVSGHLPSAVKFLEPDKTFEDSADSLRDFIIALDKEKADHLRYKVDGDVVKIFITPYKTTLTQSDLDFSQGDYNVELVLALGVKDQDHLDKALAAHGKILHDATVVTITAGQDKSNLGSTDWHDDNASSVSEMVAGLVEALKEDKPLLDEQISTALLTGIVSATDRFSNNRTSSAVMTTAAQLMAAGANQQLIAAKLEEAHDIAPGPVAGDPFAKQDKDKADEPSGDGTELFISRDDHKKPAASLEETLQIPTTPAGALTVPELPLAPDTAGQQELESQLAGIGTASAPSGSIEDIEKELESAAAEAGGTVTPVEQAPTEVQQVDVEPLTAASDATMPGFEAPPLPSLTPPLEATAEPTLAPEPAPEAPQLPPLNLSVPQLPSLDQTPPLATEPPQIVNDHGTPAQAPLDQTPPINGTFAAQNEGEAPTVDPFNVSLDKQEGATVAPVSDALNVGTAEGAALLAASEPISVPAPQAAPLGIPTLPPLPPLPSDTSLPPLPPPPPVPGIAQPSSPMPSGAISSDQLGNIFGDSTAAPQTPAPTPPDPGQFKIPGQ